MLLSLKTSITYNVFLTSRRATVSVKKQFSTDITRFFAGHCLMSCANIQARNHIIFSHCSVGGVTLYGTVQVTHKRIPKSYKISCIF